MPSAQTLICALLALLPYSTKRLGGMNHSYIILMNPRSWNPTTVKMAEEMIALVASRQLDPMVEEVIELEDIPGALARLQTRHVRGKIVAECA